MGINLYYFHVGLMDSKYFKMIFPNNLLKSEIFKPIKLMMPYNLIIKITCKVLNYL